MAEDSALWNDGIGDATTATLWDSPYDSEEFSDIYSKLIASNKAKAYIIPTFLNNLEVTESGTPAMSVKIATGALEMRGRIYQNTSAATVTLSAADVANPRIDRIVAEITFASQTIRLDVVEGAAGAVPALPALTQDGTTYQIDLAHVWVETGTTEIYDYDISDRREFSPSFSSTINGTFNNNLITNSEFMAYSARQDGTTLPPDYWDLVLTPALDETTKPAQMARGRAIEVTGNGAANEGISQTVRIEPSTVYSIRILYKITAGDEGYINVYANGAGAETVSRYIRRTGSWLDEYIYYTTTNSSTTLTIELLARNNTDVVEYGQVLVIKGYVPGTYRQFHEVLPFTASALDDGNWSSDAKNAAGSPYTIDLSASFGSLILGGTCGVLINYRAVWSGGISTVAVSGCDATPTYLTAVMNECPQIVTGAPNILAYIVGHLGIGRNLSFYLTYTVQSIVSISITGILT